MIRIIQQATTSGLQWFIPAADWREYASKLNARHEPVPKHSQVSMDRHTLDAWLALSGGADFGRQVVANYFGLRPGEYRHV